MVVYWYWYWYWNWNWNWNCIYISVVDCSYFGNTVGLVIGLEIPLPFSVSTCLFFGVRERSPSPPFFAIIYESTIIDLGGTLIWVLLLLMMESIPKKLLDLLVLLWNGQASIATRNVFFCWSSWLHWILSEFIRLHYWTRPTGNSVNSFLYYYGMVKPPLLQEMCSFVGFTGFWVNSFGCTIEQDPLGIQWINLSIEHSGLVNCTHIL